MNKRKRSGEMRFEVGFYAWATLRHKGWMEMEGQFDHIP